MAKSKYRPKPTWNTAGRQPAPTQPSGIRLSQCMIVKNEETNIERALSWGKGIVCEQIVVDTGSTDRTVEIAERMGAKVFHFAWINDFSAAKNFALDQASGSWIAFLDADEYFSPEHAQKLLPLLTAVEKNPRQIDVIHSALANLDDQGQPFEIVTQYRIFRNDPALRYENPIHEQLVFRQSGKEPYRINLSSDLTIFHTGYAQSAYKSTGKLQRNIDALRRELAQTPNDIINMGYLADALLAKNPPDLEEAEELCHRIVSEKIACEDPKRRSLMERAQCRCFDQLFSINRLQMRGLAEYLALYQNASTRFPNFPDYDFFLAEAYYRENDWASALSHYRLAESKGNAFGLGYLVSCLDAHLWELYFHAGICCEKLQDTPDAIWYITLYLKLKPEDEEMLYRFIAVSLGKDRDGNAPAMLELLRQLYDFSKLKNKLLLLKAAKRLSANALYDGIYSAFTPEEKAWFEAPAQEEPINPGFAPLMEMIAQMDEEALFAHIKNKYLALPAALQGNLSNYYHQYGFGGSLAPAENDYTVFHNRAKELKEHFSDFLWLYEQLGDARSRNVLYGILNNWVNMDMETLKQVKERRYPDYFDGGLIHCSPAEVFVDLGGYIGDTVISFVNTYRQYQRIYSYEITPSSMRLLQANTSVVKNLDARLKAAGDAPGTLYVSEGGDVSANALAETGSTPVEVVRLDDDITEPITFLKMDIEGSEQAALRGCERHIKEEHPKITVCTYHNNRDIWEIPRMIRAMDETYRLYMRYNGGNAVPTEYVLFAL
ncbi:MAG: FkbM family methyltransferase [Eubacteriales bacterium]|nr:FkbM family methyltransferase [Eubacteriales bacterium]